MYKLLKTLLVVTFLVFLQDRPLQSLWGLNIDSISFNAEDKADVLGAGNSRTADRKPDASFNLARERSTGHQKDLAQKRDHRQDVEFLPVGHHQNFLSLRTAAATCLTLPAGCL